MFDSSIMAAARGKDIGALMANGLLTSSENVLASSSKVLTSSSSFSNMNILTTINGFFCSPDNHLQQHANGNRLPSDGSREPLDLLDDDNDLSGLSSSYTEAEQQELDEFAQKFNEELEAINETAQHEQTASFGPDALEILTGSPESQSASDVSSNVQTKNRTGQRTKGRPAKASSGVASSRTTIIQCLICRKTFNNSSALAKHKLIHSDERKYTCSLCSKAFKRQDHLNGHMMTHCSKKPYECKFIGCDKSYCDARSLRRHHENHHQQLLDSSTATGSDANLTPGLTPGASSDTQSGGVFRFDLPIQVLCPGQDVLRSDADGGSPGQEMSPMSPSVSMSPSGTTQKTTAWTSGFNPLEEPKPVRCTVCDRRFRNMPALNGHMRLHGGYMKKDAMETDRADDAFSMTDKTNMDQETDHSSSFGSLSGHLSTFSSSNTLSSSEPIFSPRDVVIPKQEDDFPDVFGPPNDISASLVVGSLQVTGSQSSKTAVEFLQCLAQPTAQSHLGELDFKDGLEDHQQMMDQTQSLVNRLHLVDEAQQLEVFGHGWTDPVHCLSHASPDSQTIDSSASMPKFTTTDQRMPFGMAVQPSQIQRLMTAASQLSIDVSNKKLQQNGATDAATIYDQISSSATTLMNQGFAVGGSVNSPAVTGNPLLTPKALTINKGHLVLNRSQPMTPNYTAKHQPTLHRSASTVYSGPHTPHTPLSPFLIKPLYPQSQTPNSSTTCFQFPSRPANTKESLIPSHPSTPNLLSYQMHAPHSPFTPQAKTPYTPNTPSRARHFQFPPTPGLLETSSNTNSPYPHHHQKSYHPYSRPAPQSPRYVHQVSAAPQPNPDLEEQKRQEAIMQVEQEIAEHIEMLHQEDLKKQQQGALQARGVPDPDQKDFSLFPSVFGSAMLENPPDSIPASIDMQDLFGLEGIEERVSGPFDMDLGLPAVCPDLDAFSAINSGELTAFLGNKPQTADPVLTPAAIDLVPDGEVPEEFIQLLQEQFGNVISNPHLDLAELDVMPTVATETYAQVGCSNTDIFPTSSSFHMNFNPGPSSIPFAPPPASGPSNEGSSREKFCSPSGPLEPGKKGRKHRPEPLYIPSNVNNYGFPSQLRSPRLWDSSRKKMMPYTPPPMISPARKGSGVFWALSNSRIPQSAPPYNRGSTEGEPVRYTFDKLPAEADDDGEPPPTDVLPHVNIGPEFQADIPPVSSDKEVEPADEKSAEVKEVLVWDPKAVEGLTEDELRQYQEFACCASRPGNGTNKEDALHLLQMCNGSTKMAILKLVQGDVKRHKPNGSNGIICQESDSWKEDEIEKYNRALQMSDKDFTEIAKEVGTKTVKQCIQFYYIWKKICSDDYKALCQKRLLVAGACSLVLDAGSNQAIVNLPQGHRSSDHGL